MSSTSYAVSRQMASRMIMLRTSHPTRLRLLSTTSHLSFPEQSPHPAHNSDPKAHKLPSLKQLNAMAVDANTSQIKSATSGEASNEAKPPSYLPKDYNKKARQYIGLMTAIPVFLVLSYVLYERCEYPFAYNKAIFVLLLIQGDSGSRKGEEGTTSLSRRDEFESKVEIKIMQFLRNS
jgi:hypothetical protein